MNVTCKQLAAVFLLLFSFDLCTAQSTFQWGKRGGGMGSSSGSLADERVLDMTTDQHGNVYVLSIINNSLANVDGHSGISPRDQVSVASWNCAGGFRWMKTYGSAAPVSGSAIGVDSLGGVYVSGFLLSNNSLQYGYLGTDTTLPNSNKTMFLVKYDTSGNFQWLKMPQSDTVAIGDISNIAGMTVTPGGSVYLYTYLKPGVYENGAFTITTRGFYVLKYNRSGAYQSLVKLAIQTVGPGNQGDGEYNAEHVDFVRNAYNGRYIISGGVDGYFGSLTIGTTTLSTTNLTPAMYCASFDSTGNALWVKQANTGTYSEFHGRIAYDAIDHIYLGGFAEPGTIFNGQNFPNSLEPTFMVPIVLSLNGSTGNTIWATHASTNAGIDGRALILQNNDLYQAGIFQHDVQWGTKSITTYSNSVNSFQIYLARLNANNGTVLSIDSLSGSQAYNFPSAITKDKKGNLYIGGGFGYQLFTGPDTLLSVGGTHDWFVTKYGANNCNCVLPVANFSTATPLSNTYYFTYTGTTPIDSVRWDFGDGSYASGNSTSHSYVVYGSYNVCATAYNSCGNNVSCKTVSTGGTGVNTIAGFEQVHIYPNPVQQSFVIENATAGTMLEIYNVLGKKVQQQLLTKTPSSIDVGNLSTGIYMLRLTDASGHTGTSKFIKE